MIGYQYVVLRCVPNVDRGEFVNVGVVLYCQEATFLGCGVALDADRLRGLSPAVDVEAVRSALTRIADVCDGAIDRSAPAALGERFGWLAAPRSTMIQPGPIHGGVCDDPQVELERVMRRQVHAPRADP